MRLRWSGIAMAVLSLGLLGVDACFYPLAEILDIPGIDDPDTRCASLRSSNPPALAFERNGPPVWVVDPAAVSELVPFDVEMDPPTLAAIGAFDVPGNNSPGGLTFLGPLGLVGAPESLALVTATQPSRDEVLLFDAAIPGFVELEISVPAAVTVPSYPYLPAPGAAAVMSTNLSAHACLETILLDSRGDAISPADALCDGFYTSIASGAALGSTGSPHLFASVANPGTDGVGSEDPQFYPGAVLVYSIGITAGLDIVIAPDVVTQVIFTSGFNPTQVTAYSTSDRDFILVTVSGVIGKVQDVGGTAEVESGYVAKTEAFIDVIDAENLQLVATIPLGLAGPVGNLAIHPGGDYAVVGSMVDRWVLVVDLAPLSDPTFPTTTPPGGVVVLDGVSSSWNAVVRDAFDPYEIPARSVDGASETFCPGLIAGLAFNTSGTRLYATDYCDGTLSVIGAGSTPTLSPNPQLVNLTAPIDAADTALPRGPGAIAVRPGAPSSFTGADVFVLVGEPSGLMCSVAVESGS